MPSKLKANYIRFTDDEYAQLTQKANQANLSLSRYLIESGLSFSVNSLSPYLREHIEQIKFESALLQHHLDLLLNKKSYIEQLASLGELDNLISFLSFSAKSLHDIFLADSNQNKINQFISNHNEINHNYSSNCSNCHQLNNALLNNNSLINEQLNHQQLNQLNATSSINHLSINNQLNSHQPNTDLSISQQLNNNPANNTQLDNSQLHNNPLNDDLLNNIQIVTSNCSSDTLSNDSLSNNNSDISHNSNSDHSDNDNSDNDNPFNLFIASGISDNKANKPTISFFCNSNIVVVGLNNSFSTYSPISLISYYFYLDEDIPISFVFLSSCYPVFINQFSSAQILEAPHNEDSVFDCPIVDTPVFEIPFIEISTADISVTGTPFIDASLIEAPIVDSSVVEVIENSPNSAFTDSSIIASINENLIFDISFSQNLISQNLISQNSTATTLALSPISDIAPTNNPAPTDDKDKDLNQLICSSPVKELNLPIISSSTQDLNQLNISSPVDALCPITRPSTSSDNLNQLIIPSPTYALSSNPLSISHLDNKPLHNSHLEQSVLEQPLLEQSPLDVSCLDHSHLDGSHLAQNNNTLSLSSLPSPNNPSITNTHSSTNTNLTDLNQLNCSSIDSIVPVTHNLSHSLVCSSMSNIDNIASTSDCSSIEYIAPTSNKEVEELHLLNVLSSDANSNLPIESHLDFDTENHPDPDLVPSQFHIIDDGSIDPNLIVSFPSHLLYPQDLSYSYYDFQDLDDLENLEQLNPLDNFSPFDLPHNNEVLECDLHNQSLESNPHNQLLKALDNNQVFHNNFPNLNSNFSDLISSHSDNNCSSLRHSYTADLDNTDPNNRDFP